jgi:hypothetical protein
VPDLDKESPRSVGSMLLIISGYQWGPCCSSSPVISGVHVAHHLRLSVGSMLLIISVISGVHVTHHLRLSVGSMLLIEAPPNSAPSRLEEDGSVFNQ